MIIGSTICFVGLILTAKFFKEPSRWHLLMKEWSIWAPLLLFNRERDEMSCEDRIDVKNISRFYFGVENPAEVPYSEENILKLTDMVGLSWFFFSFDRDSKLLANNGTPVYTFILTSPPDFSVFDLFRLKMGEIGRMFFFRRFGYNPFNQKYGVCHGDDLCFLFPFNVPGFPTRVKTEEQKNTQKYLVDMVYSFAVDGVPKLSDVHWPPLSKTNSEYLDIGSCLMLTRSTHLDNQEEKERIPSIRPFTEFHAQIAVNRANL
ncbi:venom carboxylesterase-6-like [Eurytemora carolleeae]|uniref:venom carboxylesterase-6-like n=1 Tax=Eurytemora carolleeae TaxID=1294199 RepID=UPI000C7800E0|nr:venom carboxylesterase-6-like [Eurytemora carolleeae]|eukprot:XP_023324454.1 venom carboxylesterase-6-like [Eurytemora affinis]